jgi:hypothetical protein
MPCLAEAGIPIVSIGDWKHTVFTGQATETGTTTAWVYNFGKNGKMLNRHEDGEKQRAASVRCIRDVKR